MSLLQVALAGLAALSSGGIVLWLASLARRDASLVDRFWGAGFALLALLYAALGDGPARRTALLTGLTTVWGVRLSLHIHFRNRGRGEDPRYAAWRAEARRSFWWKSLFKIFLLQALIMWIVSAPLLLGTRGAGHERLAGFELIGAVVWLVGFLFEAIGDEQLRRFRRDPANRGRVLDRGLWAWTRHPNYFGDAVVWWGLYLVGVGSPGGGWGVVSPVLMTLLLLRVSGVTLLERQLRESRPGYTEYVRRTSAFLPLPPRRRLSAGQREPGAP